MVMMKKLFYVKFCTRAVEEGNIPADMKPFIEYIANTLGKQAWFYLKNYFKVFLWYFEGRKKI